MKWTLNLTSTPKKHYPRTYQRENQLAINMDKKKIGKLSKGLQKLILEEPNAKTSGTVSQLVSKSAHPVSSYAERTLNHLNGGSTLQAALWLKEHLDNGGKLVVTIAGALSSFQVGIMLAELIRKNKVHLISATGANH